MILLHCYSYLVLLFKAPYNLRTSAILLGHTLSNLCVQYLPIRALTPGGARCFAKERIVGISARGAANSSQGTEGEGFTLVRTNCEYWKGKLNLSTALHNTVLFSYLLTSFVSHVVCARREMKQSGQQGCDQERSAYVPHCHVVAITESDGLLRMSS